MEFELALFLVSDERDIIIEQANVRWANGDRFGLEILGIDPLERERLRLFLKTVVMPSGSDVSGRVENRIQHPVGQAYLLPPLSSGGALIALP